MVSSTGKTLYMLMLFGLGGLAAYWVIVPLLPERKAPVVPPTSTEPVAVTRPAEKVLVSKNVNFRFAPNSSELDMKNQDNLQFLLDIKGMYEKTPSGVRILVRGHVDDGQKAEFTKNGAEALKSGADKAVKLSLNRANEIKKQLITLGIAEDRIDTVGCGWEEPLGSDRDANRRVEVQILGIE